jgi:hypothetical protein
MSWFRPCQSELFQGHCQRKNILLPGYQIGILQTLISHDFFGSIQAIPQRLKYSEFSSDSALRSHLTGLRRSRKVRNINDDGMPIWHAGQVINFPLTVPLGLQMGDRDGSINVAEPTKPTTSKLECEAHHWTRQLHVPLERAIVVFGVCYSPPAIKFYTIGPFITYKCSSIVKRT